MADEKQSINQSGICAALASPIGPSSMAILLLLLLLLLLHCVARTHGLKCFNGWMNGWMDGHFPFVVLSMHAGFLICTFVLLLPRSLKCPLMSKEDGRTWTDVDGQKKMPTARPAGCIKG